MISAWKYNLAILLKMLEFIIVFVSVCIIILVELHGYNPPAVLGIYSRENGYFWLKYYFMKFLLHARKVGINLNVLEKVYEVLYSFYRLLQSGLGKAMRS